MTNPLDHNLTQLLTRAYEPARPRSQFVAQLFERALDGVADQSLEGIADESIGRPSEWRTSWRDLRIGTSLLRGLAAAALVLILVGGYLQARKPAPVTVAELSRKGQAAVRFDGGPWAAAASGELPWLSQRLEAVAPDRNGLDLVMLTGDRIELGVNAHARLREGPGGPEIDVDEGTVRLEKAPHSPNWRVRTADGELDWEVGALTLRVLEASGETVVDGDGGRGMWIAEGGVRGPVSRGFLRAGRWFEAALAEPAPAPVPEGGGRVAVAHDPGPATLAGPAAVSGVAPGAAAVRTGILRGQVRSGPGDAPLDEFRVWLRREVELPEVSEPTCYPIEDAAGQFVLAGLDPGNYSVHVEAPGHAAWRRPRTPVSEAPLDLDVVLDAGATLWGYVIDPRTDTPIVGALVLVTEDLPQQLLGMHEFLSEPMPFAHAITDAGGAFELTHVSAGKHVLRASHADFAASWRWVAEVENGETLEVEPFELGQGGSVAGRVERRDGGPLPNAMVVASRIDGTESLAKQHYGAALAGPDGSYRIDHLAQGNYVVINVSETLGGESEWGLLQQTAVRDGAVERVDFLSVAQVRRVSGRLLDAAGKPVSGWFLTLAESSAPDEFVDWVATGIGPGGTFEFAGMEPGPHGLFLGRHANRSFFRCRVLEVPEAGRRDYTVQLSDTELSGVLVDASTGEAAFGYVLIEMFEQERGKWEFAARDMELDGGEFRFPYLEPGRYRVTVSSAPGLVSRRFEPFDLVAGEPLRLELDLAPAGSLLIECNDEFGKPVRGVRLEVRNPNGSEALISSFDDGVTVSDFEGRLRRQHLPLVTLDATVRAAGFESVNSSVTPTAEGTLWRIVLPSSAR